MPQDSTDGTLKFYEQPYLGQPFMRVQNENSVEYGMVSGMTTVGEYIDHKGERRMGWTALLQSRLHGEFRFTHRDSWISAEVWHPMTAKDLAAARGAAGFADVVPSAAFYEFVEVHIEFREQVKEHILALEERLAALEGVVAENQTLLAGALGAISRLENPGAPRPAPAAAPTNGRTARVPA